MYSKKEAIYEYLISCRTMKKDILRFRNDEEEIMTYSYGCSAIIFILNKIDEDPSANISYLVEKQIHNLNRLIGLSKDQDQKMMYSIQIDFLTDLYDYIYL